jgi:hypothetical protein
MVQNSRHSVLFALVSMITIIVVSAGSAWAALSTSTANVSVMAGASQSVTITGGTGFYSITSSDTGVAEAFISNNAGDQAKITGISLGNAVVTIEDSAGDTATISVQVSGITFSQNSVAVTPQTSVTLTILTGSAFYQIDSSDDQVATAVESKGVITITGVSSGTAVITVLDSNQSIATIDVTVNATTVSLVVLEVAESQTVTLTGGTGYYKIDNTEDTVASVTLNNDDTVDITGISAGQTTVTITDSQSNVFTLDVTVQLAKPVLTVSMTGTVVKLSWTEIAGADSYVLYYAPADANGDVDGSKVDQVNVGSLEFFLIDQSDLPPGFHYYVAVQGVNNSSPSASSQVSNIMEINL